MSVPSFLYPTNNIPDGVQTYAQRNVQYTQRPGAEYGPGTEVKIQLDTGTPSAFLDVTQSYLRFRLKITNKNFQIDYVNFTYAGAAAFIDTLTITANGTVIEKLTDYNVLFNHYQQIMCKATKPYQLYISRPSDQIMSNNLNAIKLPMVDRRGYIMGSGPQTAPQYTGYYGNDKFLGVTTSNIFAPFPMNKAMNPNCFPDSIPPLSISSIPSWDNLDPARMQDYFLFLTNVQCIPVGCTSAIKPNSDGYYLHEGFFSATKYATPTSLNPTPATVTINPFCVDTTTPMDTTKAGDSLAIPGVFEFDVTLPLLSGIVGVLATKALPTFLLNDFCITLTLAQPQRVFKATMDPARIIRGTHRDFITNCAFPSVAANQATTLDAYCSSGAGFKAVNSSLNTLFNNPYPALGGTRNTMFSSLPLPFVKAAVSNTTTSGGLSSTATVYASTSDVTGGIPNYMKFVGIKQNIVGTTTQADPTQYSGLPMYNNNCISTPYVIPSTGSSTEGNETSENAAGTFNAGWEFGNPTIGTTDQTANNTTFVSNVIRVPLRDSTCLYDAPPVYGTGVQTFLSQYILSPIGLSPGTLGLQSGTMGYGFTSTPITFPPPEIVMSGGITSDLTLAQANAFYSTNANLTKTINTARSNFTGSKTAAYTQDATYLLGTPGCFFSPNGQIPQYLLSSGYACATYGNVPVPTFIPVTSEFSNGVIPLNNNFLTAFPTSFNPANTFATGQSNLYSSTQSFKCNNATGPSFFGFNNYSTGAALGQQGLTTTTAASLTLTSFPTGPGSLLNANSYQHNAYLMGTLGPNQFITVPTGTGTATVIYSNCMGCASNVGFKPWVGDAVDPLVAAPPPNTADISVGVAGIEGTIDAPTAYYATLQNANPFAGPTSTFTGTNLTQSIQNWVTGTTAVVDSFYTMNELTCNAYPSTNAAVAGYSLGPQQMNLASSNALYSGNVGSAVVAPLYSSFNLDFGQNSLYGTFLNQSEPQSLGILKYSNGISLIPTYVLTDAVFFTMQLLLPQEVAGAIVAAASTGAIEMETISITCSNTRMTKGATSQNIQLLQQLGCANTMFFLFRPEQTFANNDNQQIYYDSLCGYNPFAAVNFTANSNTIGYGTTSMQIDNMLVSNNTDLSIQLQIGNDLKPRTPIRTVKEIGTELQKALHGLNSPDFGINISTNITYDRVNGSIVPVYDIYSNGGFLTTFIPVNLLQDQTKLYNPMIMYGSNPQNNSAVKNIPTLDTDTNTSVQATVTDYYTMSNQNLPINFYNVNQFVTPSSTFMLGFDLDAVAGLTGKMQTGTYLGNFQTTLNLTGLHLCKENLVYLTTITYHQLRLAIQMGGMVAPYK